jgi:hypothetical protein
MAPDILQRNVYQHPADIAAADSLCLILSRIIDSSKNDPAQLRKVIYELARVTINNEGELSSSQVTTLETSRYLRALDAAIERIESFSSEEEEVRGLLSRYRGIERTNSSANNALVINYGPVETYVAKPRQVLAGAVLFGRRANMLWPTAAPLLRLAFAAIFAVTLGVVIGSRYGFTPFQNSVSPSSNASREGNNGSMLDSARLATQPPDPSIPSAYGVYALINGQPKELEFLPIKVPDAKVFMSVPIMKPSRAVFPDGKISFIAFRRDLVTDAPDRVAIRIVAKVMRSLSFNQKGVPKIAKVDDLWAVRNNSYEFKVAPLNARADMVAIRPDSPDFSFPAGRYALVLKAQAYDFTVEGPITETAQCLERTEAVTGPIYSECRSP